MVANLRAVYERLRNKLDEIVSFGGNARDDDTNVFAGLGNDDNAELEILNRQLHFVQEQLHSIATVYLHEHGEEEDQQLGAIVSQQQPLQHKEIELLQRIANAEANARLGTDVRRKYNQVIQIATDKLRVLHPLVQATMLEEGTIVPDITSNTDQSVQILSEDVEHLISSMEKMSQDLVRVRADAARTASMETTIAELQIKLDRLTQEQSTWKFKYDQSESVKHALGMMNRIAYLFDQLQPAFVAFIQRVQTPAERGIEKVTAMHNERSSDKTQREETDDAFTLWALSRQGISATNTIRQQNAFQSLARSCAAPSFSSDHHSFGLIDTVHTVEFPTRILSRVEKRVPLSPVSTVFPFDVVINERCDDSILCMVMAQLMESQRQHADRRVIVVLPGSGLEDSQQSARFLAELSKQCWSDSEWSEVMVKDDLITKGVVVRTLQSKAKADQSVSLVVLNIEADQSRSTWTRDLERAMLLKQPSQSRKPVFYLFLAVMLRAVSDDTIDGLLMADAEKAVWIRNMQRRVYEQHMTVPVPHPVPQVPQVPQAPQVDKSGKTLEITALQPSATEIALQASLADALASVTAMKARADQVQVELNQKLNDIASLATTHRGVVASLSEQLATVKTRRDELLSVEQQLKTTQKEHAETMTKHLTELQGIRLTHMQELQALRNHDQVMQTLSGQELERRTRELNAAKDAAAEKAIHDLNQRNERLQIFLIGLHERLSPAHILLDDATADFILGNMQSLNDGQSTLTARSTVERDVLEARDSARALQIVLNDIKSTREHATFDNQQRQLLTAQVQDGGISGEVASFLLHHVDMMTHFRQIHLEHTTKLQLSLDQATALQRSIDDKVAEKVVLTERLEQARKMMTVGNETASAERLRLEGEVHQKTQEVAALKHKHEKLADQLRESRVRESALQQSVDSKVAEYDTLSQQFNEARKAADAGSNNAKAELLRLSGLIQTREKEIQVLEHERDNLTRKFHESQDRETALQKTVNHKSTEHATLLELLEDARNSVSTGAATASVELEKKTKEIEALKRQLKQLTNQRDNDAVLLRDEQGRTATLQANLDECMRLLSISSSSPDPNTSSTFAVLKAGLTRMQAEHSSLIGQVQKLQEGRTADASKYQTLLQVSQNMEQNFQQVQEKLQQADDDLRDLTRTFEVVLTGLNEQSLTTEARDNIIKRLPESLRAPLQNLINNTEAQQVLAMLGDPKLVLTSSLDTMVERASKYVPQMSRKNIRKWLTPLFKTMLDIQTNVFSTLQQATGAVGVNIMDDDLLEANIAKLDTQTERDKVAQSLLNAGADYDFSEQFAYNLKELIQYTRKKIVSPPPPDPRIKKEVEDTTAKLLQYKQQHLGSIQYSGDLSNLTLSQLTDHVLAAQTNHARKLEKQTSDLLKSSNDRVASLEEQLKITKQSLVTVPLQMLNVYVSLRQWLSTQTDQRFPQSDAYIDSKINMVDSEIHLHLPMLDKTTSKSIAKLLIDLMKQETGLLRNIQADLGVYQSALEQNINDVKSLDSLVTSSIAGDSLKVMLKSEYNRRSIQKGERDKQETLRQQQKALRETHLGQVADKLVQVWAANVPEVEKFQLLKDAAENSLKEANTWTDSEKRIHEILVSMIIDLQTKEQRQEVQESFVSNRFIVEFTRVLGYMTNWFATVRHAISMMSRTTSDFLENPGNEQAKMKPLQELEWTNHQYVLEQSKELRTWVVTNQEKMLFEQVNGCMDMVSSLQHSAIRMMGGIEISPSTSRKPMAGYIPMLTQQVTQLGKKIADLNAAAVVTKREFDALNIPATAAENAALMHVPRGITRHDDGEYGDKLKALILLSGSRSPQVDAELQTRLLPDNLSWTEIKPDVRTVCLLLQFIPLRKDNAVKSAMSRGSWWDMLISANPVSDDAFIPDITEACNKYGIQRQVCRLILPAEFAEKIDSEVWTKR